ncbi:vomeronasal type-1 receptor 4-like [Lepus europaeus]|uniref:vomeronasal type-1 receptor 4-like n=1 Tax=Lepus europaeus TaxID=9983 RepID=UPI002B47F18F|nr:vomeronasal type-1 receptor 4-like [Lepus europaeus]
MLTVVTSMPMLVLEAERNWGLSMSVRRREAFSKEVSLESGNLRLSDNNQTLGTNGMVARDLTMGMIFLSQTITGILGNFSLLSHYLYLYFTGCKFRPTDLIIKHLTVANCLIILFRGVPQTMAALGLNDNFSDIGCKLVFYVQRVSRDVSAGSTCLLSISQAITISPENPRWAEFKAKAPKYIGPFITLLWILNFILNILVPLYVTERKTNKNITEKVDYVYCIAVNPGEFTESLYAAVVFFQNVLFVDFMLGSSGYMIFILYRHKKQVQYIHRTNISSRSSPESRATHSILVLVSTFVPFCIFSSIFHICLTVLKNPSVWLVNTSALITGSFSTVSPYILMSHDSRVPRLCCVPTRNTESSGCKFGPTDLIIKDLIVANCLVILLKESPNHGSFEDEAFPQ